MDQYKPWDFFNGASQNNNQSSGGGALLHMSGNHSFKIKMGLGPRMKNYVELLSLKFILLMPKEKMWKLYSFM